MAEPTYRRVTKDEFYAAIGKENCHPQIQPPEQWPYTQLFKTPDGRIVGKKVCVEVRRIEKEYWLPVK